MASHGAHRIYSSTQQTDPYLNTDDSTPKTKGNSYQPLLYYLESPDYDYLMGKSLRCSVGELKIKV